MTQIQQIHKHNPLAATQRYTHIAQNQQNVLDSVSMSERIILEREI